MPPLIHPATRSTVPPSSASLLEAIEQALGRTPLLFAVAAHSPAALQSLWRQYEAAEQAMLPEPLRVAIALRVAQLDRCDYCLAAHTVVATGADDAAHARTRGPQSGPAVSLADRASSRISIAVDPAEAAS